MQISISTRHGHLSDASQEKIRGKVEKLGRLFDRLASIEVTVDLEHENAPCVDVQISAEHKHDFVASGKADTLMTALDGAIHKVEQQLRKYKERIQDHHRADQPRKAAAVEERLSGESAL